MGSKKFRGLGDRHLHYVTDAAFVVENFERLRIVTFPAAIFAPDVAVGQETHLEFDRSLTGARLTTAALGVKGKTTRAVSPHTGDRQLREKTPNLVKDLDVG